MKLSAWARGLGVSYRTALNWFHAGTLPVSARQLPTGTIVVEPSAEPSGETVAYCRVSSADQRADVERRAGRVAQERRRQIEYKTGWAGTTVHIADRWYPS